MNKTKQKKIECKSEKSRSSQENVEDMSPTINTEMIDTDAKDGGDLSESSDEEWEDVEDIQPGVSPKKKKQTESAVSSVVEIDIEMPGAAKKKRKAYDWADYYRRLLNRFNKDRQIELHKIHLLCLLANGFHRNKVCNEPLLQATALSLIPPDVLKYKPKMLNTDFVYKLLFWFRKHFPVTAALPSSSSQNYPVFQLMQAMQNQKFSSVEEVVIVFVLCIRALGGDARLVFSLQPITWKADVVEKPKQRREKQSKKNKPPVRHQKQASKAAKTNKKNSARQKAKDVKKEVRDVAKEDEQMSSKKREAKGGRKRVSTSVTRKAGQNGNSPKITVDKI
ncbi:putative DNA repair protein [Apostichopus japonicus]|uniref:Putative DNA repair protein n=1 Tax=Stichopus japonicus TaxID=307972 RepID=A0A2G8LRF7_STIJA|nr:putative DNA repair protein [Apostichopus japonicus]